MSLVRSFDAIADSDARVLVLESMPGKASLDAGEYYAYPRNAFWKIMSELLAIDTAADYGARTQALVANGIALWDVMRSCEREGSLDSDIVESSIMPNNFRGFFESHSRIERVLFNGAKAEQTFEKLVLLDLGGSFADIVFHRLPSTSPANAGTSYAKKREAWRAIIS